MHDISGIQILPAIRSDKYSNRLEAFCGDAFILLSLDGSRHLSASYFILNACCEIVAVDVSLVPWQT